MTVAIRANDTLLAGPVPWLKRIMVPTTGVIFGNIFFFMERESQRVNMRC